MARYHPGEDWLAAYASGGIDEQTSVLIATHLTYCPECREEVARHEEIGGALLDVLGAEKIDSLDEGEAFVAPKSLSESHDIDAPPPKGSLAAIAPTPLLKYVYEITGKTDLESLSWSFYGVGIDRAVLVDGPEGPLVRLLRAKPGAKFPHHQHLSEELTVVLQGAYRDNTGRYDVGDVQCVPTEAAHQPIIEEGDICIALVVSERPTVPTNFLTRIAQKLLDG
ncbi:MAG: ChrR family anti-sigma-E factor [Pseudomonadota bacterium]